MERTNEKNNEFRFGDSGPKYMFRGPKIEWGILVLKPDETLGVHMHEEVEETFYFEKGKPKMVIDDKPYRVEEGDAFKISPREKHDIINDTGENTKIIFIKAPYLPKDKVKC